MRVNKHEVDIPNTLEGFKEWNFSNGISTGNDFKVFSKLFKAEIQRQVQSEDQSLQIVVYSPGHYFVSGFVYNVRHNSYVYFSISDVRHFDHEWYTDILVRTAKNENDYTGGINNFCNLKDFGSTIKFLTYIGGGK